MTLTLAGISCPNPNCGAVWGGMLPEKADSIRCPICRQMIVVRKIQEWVKLSYEEQKKLCPQEADYGNASQGDGGTP